MKSKYTIRKWNGDDSLSWAVLYKGNPRPIISGLSRKEAQYHKQKLEEMDAKPK